MRQLVGKLGHSICSDKNLVPFRLLRREAMPKPERVSICFAQDYNFSLEHLRTIDSEHSQTDSQKCHKLVNCLMLWERTNAKPLVIILLFELFDKTCNFAVLICWAVLVPANQYIPTQK